MLLSLSISLFVDLVTETDIGAFQTNDGHFYRVRKLERTSVRRRVNLSVRRRMRKTYGEGEEEK